MLFITNLYSEDLTIIPLKKPVLDKITKQQKLTQIIITPKSKPFKEKENQQLSKEQIKPKTKPSKEINEKITKVAEKVVKKKSKKKYFINS